MGVSGNIPIWKPGQRVLPDPEEVEEDEESDEYDLVRRTFFLLDS